MYLLTVKQHTLSGRVDERMYASRGSSTSFDVLYWYGKYAKEYFPTATTTIVSLIEAPLPYWRTPDTEEMIMKSFYCIDLDKFITQQKGDTK